MSDSTEKDPFIGQRFGKIAVVRCLNPEASKSYREYLCKCDCGKEKAIKYHELFQGKLKSCGCARKEGLRIAREKFPLEVHDCRECRWHVIGKVFPVHICQVRKKDGSDYDVIPEEKIGRKRCMYFMGK